MAAKKKAAKKSHDTQQLEKRPKTIFGLDVREVGAAIATAVVAELSQLALKQISKSLDGDTVAQTQSSVNDVADSAGSAAKNPVKTIANVAKDAVDNVKPAVSKAVSGTNGAAEALSDSVDSAVDATASGRGFSQDTAQLIEDTVRQAVMAVSSRFETTKQNVSGTAVDTASAVKTKVKALKTDASDKKKAKKSKKKKHKK
jgi:phage-related protein